MSTEGKVAAPRFTVSRADDRQSLVKPLSPGKLVRSSLRIWKLELIIAKPLSIEDVEVAPPKADEVRIKVL
jgi:hypothetical protein